MQEAAEKAVAERVLLREDAERYLTTAQGEEVGKRFARSAGSVAGLNRDR